MSKPLDLRAVISDAEKVAKDDPSQAKVTTKLKEPEGFVSSFVEVIQELGQANDENFSEKYKKLKEKAK